MVSNFNFRPAIRFKCFDKEESIICTSVIERNIKSIKYKHKGGIRWTKAATFMGITDYINETICTQMNSPTLWVY